MRSLYLVVPLLFMFALSGCNDADMATFFSHVQGGGSIAVDPATGAITPSVSVNIKDVHGQVLFRAEAGQPVSKEIVHRLIANGARSIVHVSSFTASRRMVSRADPCAPETRSVTYRAEPIAETVDLQVTPSLREQLRNIVLFRDTRYVRNSRPVERVLEKAQRFAPLIPDAQIIDASTDVNDSPAPPPATNASFPDIAPATKSGASPKSLDDRVASLENEVSQLLLIASRLEAKLK